MAIPIINPFNKNIESDPAHCFGCSPTNPIGLQMQFVEEDALLKAFWTPIKHFEGFNNVLHGGIQATLLDEMAAWVVFVKCKTAGVTQSIKIDYQAPVFMNEGKLLIIGKLLRAEDKTAVIKAELFSGENKLCAEAEVTYYLFSEAVARRKYNYPGIEAFYS
jgi:uncharacterized protein (TIGR00369 family)